jgi:hypothetical protein
MSENTEIYISDYDRFLRVIREEDDKDFKMVELEHEFTHVLLFLLLYDLYNRKNLLKMAHGCRDNVRNINDKTQRYNFIIDKDIVANDDVYTLIASPKLDKDIEYELVLLRIDTNFEYYNREEFLEYEKLDLYIDIYKDYKDNFNKDNFNK